MEWIELLFVYIGILLIFYLPRIFIVKYSYTINNKIAWIILSIHLVALAVLIINMLLLFYNMSFRGYQSTSIIYIIMVATGIPFYLFRSSTFLPEFLNVMLSVICAFSVPAFAFCLYAILTDKRASIYYDGPAYRLEEGNYKKFGADDTFPDLYVKSGVVEKLYTINAKPINKKIIQAIQITKIDSSTIAVYVHHTDKKMKDPLLIIVPVDK